jgi:hypothetical protein
MLQQAKQNSAQNFLSEQNVVMLLDIIMDGDILKNQPVEVVNATEGVFYNNIHGFYKNSIKDSYSLIDLNKQYIMLILKYVESNFVRNDMIRNDTIRNDKPRQQRVTFEDIQNEKRSQFDKDLNAKQTEFTSAMTRPVPPIPKFSDTNTDEPLNEMELAIKQMTEQRKYDMEQITQSFGGKKIDPPIQTSINNKTVNNAPLLTQDRHYIKIDNQEAKIDTSKIIDLDMEDDVSFEKNLFSKLHFRKNPVSLQSLEKNMEQSLEQKFEEKKDNKSIIAKLQQNVFEMRQNMEIVNRDISKILDLCTQLSNR